MTQNAPGATSADTKDVVDAKVAEGEFIFPANVVRFIGIDKLKKMMMKAEEELSTMEQEGLVGGGAPQQDAPQQAFAEGGMPVREPFNPQAFSAVGSTLYQPPVPEVIDTPKKATEVKNYVNDKGQILPVTFVNGQPSTQIPPGFYPQGTPVPKQPSSTQQETEDNNAGNDEDFSGDPTGGAFGGRNPFELSQEELASSYENIKAGYAKIDQFSALGALHPLAAMGLQAAKANSVANMNRAALVAEARGDTSLAATIRNDVDALSGPIGDKLNDMVASGQGRFSRDLESWTSSGNVVTPYGMDNRSSVANNTNSSSEYDRSPTPSQSNYTDRSTGLSATSQQSRSTIDQRPSQSTYSHADVAAVSNINSQGDKRTGPYKRGGLVTRPKK